VLGIIRNQLRHTSSGTPVESNHQFVLDSFRFGPENIFQPHIVEVKLKSRMVLTNPLVRVMLHGN
jgi:hypothetical protein